MEFYDVLKIVGIFSFIFLSLTFVFGFFKFKLKKRIFLHKLFAFATIVLAIVHLILVIYLTYFK
ncbi:MAG: hypothetical protein ACP5QT_05180 [Brevinematia bacterium]